jgi:hypothetical protein
MCGSPSGMVGVGRPACAGGGARRRRGVRHIQGAIDQSNGLESFIRDQGRGVREELKNGSPECPVYARRRAGDWGGLATVAEALAAMAGGKELAGAKEGCLAVDGERGVK